MNPFVERLRRMDTCAVSDALDKLGLPGSVTGIPRVSTDQRIAGRVLTVKLDRAEGRSNTRHLCTAAIEAAAPGDIIVCEQRTGLDAGLVDNKSASIDEVYQGLQFVVRLKDRIKRAAERPS